MAAMIFLLPFCLQLCVVSEPLFASGTTDQCKVGLLTLRRRSQNLAKANGKRAGTGSLARQHESRLSRKLLALHKHAAQLATVIDADDVIQHTLDAMEHALGFDYADFTMGENGWLRTKGYRGLEINYLDLKLDGPGIIVKAANLKQPTLVADTRKETAYVKGRKGMLSELAVPVLVNDQTIGVLNAESTRLNAFTEEDRQLLETLASHVSSAFNRLEREEALEQSASLHRATLESTADGILVVDRMGMITTFNKSYAEMWGIPEHLVATRDDAKLLQFVLDQLEHPEQFLRKVQELYSKPEEKSFDAISFKDGRLFERYSQPQRLGDRVVGRVWSFRDVTERRRAEEAYRTVVKHALQGLAIIQDSRIVFANQALLEMSGYSLEAALSLSPNDVMGTVHPEDRERVWTGMQDLLAGKPVSFPQAFRLRRKDGTIRWVETLASRIVFQGKPAIQVAYLDITERKQMEEALRRRAQELESLQTTLLEITGQHELLQLLNRIVERAAHLLDAPGGGMYLCDQDKQEVRCVVGYNTKINPVGTVFKYGEGAAGVVAQTGKPLIIDDYSTWPRRAAAYEQEKPFGAIISAPMIWQSKVIGVIHVLRYDAKRFTEEDLELLRMFANHAAIAVENQRHSENLERMVAERTIKLTESQHQLQLIADSLPAVISYVDPQQRYRFNNKTYEEWFDQSRNAVLGRHVGEVLGEQAYERIQGRMEAALSGVGQAFEYELMTRLGNRHVSATYIPDFGEHGQVKGVFVLGIDITERKSMEERLLKAERLAAIGETAAMVGHDLRNPLQAISAAAYVLKKNLPTATTQQAREMLDAIENSVRYSDRIVSDLLEYSQDLRLEFSETTPKSLARDAFLQVKIPKNITVSDSTSDEPRIQVDVAKIRRLFINLIENAIDAMPTGGELTVSSKVSNDNLEVNFADTGKGIPENVLQKLWKPLITTKPKGLGLGLAICKRIAEAHGGSMSFASKAAEGTTFTLSLPIMPRQEGAKRP
jgi:PAS domain S-box-containing protein